MVIITAFSQDLQTQWYTHWYVGGCWGLLPEHRSGDSIRPWWTSALASAPHATHTVCCAPSILLSGLCSWDQLAFPLRKKEESPHKNLIARYPIESQFLWDNVTPWTLWGSNWPHWLSLRMHPRALARRSALFGQEWAQQALEAFGMCSIHATWGTVYSASYCGDESPVFQIQPISS